MVAQFKQRSLPRSPEPSQTLQRCRDFVKQLIQDISEDTEIKEAIQQQTNQYSNEINNNIAKLTQKILDNQNKIKEVEQMLLFPPGSWVKNNLNKQGKVIDLKIAGRIPEVHVLWQRATVQVPERPFNLKLLDDEDLNYVWNEKSKNPKLFRFIDHHECDDFKILKGEYHKLEDQRKKAYCKKRFNLLALKNIQHGMRVKAAGKTGKTLNFHQYDLSGFVEIAVTFDLDENEECFQEKFYCPSEIENLRYPNNCSQVTEEKLIDIADISLEQTITQQRVKINSQTVTEYAEAMLNDDHFPAIKVKYDGDKFWLIDGFHTSHAAYSNGQTQIRALISFGTKREAILESVAVNTEHGLRRSNADKRKAVTTLLEDSEWGQWSDREIGKRCKVDHKTVGKIRKNLSGISLNSERIFTDKHGNKSVMNTANIGSEELTNRTDLKDKSTDFFPLSKTTTDNINNLTGEFPSDKQKDSEKTTPGECLNKLNSEFVVGHVVQIESNRTDKRLIGHNKSYGVITAINAVSVDLKIWDKTILAVSPNDLKLMKLEDMPTICISFNLSKISQLLMMFDNLDQIFDAAIVAKKRWQEKIRTVDNI